jgi:hypothetical protein
VTRSYFKICPSSELKNEFAFFLVLTFVYFLRQEFTEPIYNGTADGTGKPVSDPPRELSVGRRPTKAYDAIINRERRSPKPMLPPEQVLLFNIITVILLTLTFLAFPAEYAAYSVAFCFRPIFFRLVLSCQIS